MDKLDGRPDFMGEFVCTCGADRDDCVDCMRDAIESMQAEIARQHAEIARLRRVAGFVCELDWSDELMIAAQRIDNLRKAIADVVVAS